MQFAKVREDQGQLTEASVEYERGGDAESAVRLLLQAADLSKALDIARRSCSPAAATLIVQHCLQESNWAGAVEFSILAGDYTSAWQVRGFAYLKLCLLTIELHRAQVVLLNKAVGAKISKPVLLMR